MSNHPDDPALKPTDHYDEAALKRARELLNAMPETVGPYRILERIGGGGMGEVYRAEQRSPIRRQVALKFIKLGMDSKLVIARFEAERQALALMDHPHIAKVFDAGTDETGRPYFVMEYVKGKPITEYADQNHLSIAERLELFDQVCQAIQHAHHKGVIHRDLKPGNVLVSTQDDEPFAKVIDFGIAKAISQKLTDETLFTQHDQFVGTPQYMSPEQAEGSVDIDTRTDVYSLGVMLYELLTGSTPFSSHEFKAAAFEQIKKMIIEVDPPKPSTRLSSNTPTLTSLAAFRRIEPKRLGTIVQGELDWIVMKAIEKDRKRRYETPTSLANDILAHLKGEPVQAAPPSTAYRIQKIISKYRGPVCAVAAVGIVLLLGIIGTTWGYYRAERNADLERIAKKEVSIQRDEATTAREQAINAMNALEVAKNDAVAAQVRAEHALARGFVRPLVGTEPLSNVETESLWELATLESNTIGLRMLDEASRNPQMTTQLLHCAEPAVVAAIGLNPDLRRRVLSVFRSRVQDRTLTLDHRACIAWLTLMLLDPPGPDSAACVGVIQESAEYAMPDPSQVIALIAPEPAADLLFTAISRPQADALTQSRIANAIAGLTPRLERELTTRVSESALAILLNSLADRKRNDSEFVELADAALTLTASLETETTVRTCKMVSEELLSRLNDPSGIGAIQLNRLDVRRVIQRLGVISSRMALTVNQHVLNEMLSALLNPQLRDQEHENIAIFFFSWLSDSRETDSRKVIIDRLLVEVLEPKHTDIIFDILATALGELSEQVEPEVATRVTDAILERIVDRNRTSIQVPSKRCLDALTRLSRRLEPNAALRVAEGLLAVLNDPHWTDQQNALLNLIYDLSFEGQVDSLAGAIAAIANRVETEVNARIADSLIGAITNPQRTDDNYRALASTFDAMAATLEPEVAARATDKLLVAIADSRRTARNLASLAEAVASISSRLETVAAARACEVALDRLMAAIVDPKLGEYELYSLAEAVSMLCSRLNASTAARARETMSQRLLSAISDAKVNEANSPDFATLAKAVAVLSSKMESKLAARVCESASESLIAALSDLKSGPNTVSSISFGLALLLERLEPARARAIALRALRFMTVRNEIGMYIQVDERVKILAMLSRHLGPTVGLTIRHHLVVLKLEQPWVEFMGWRLSDLARQILTVLQCEEPHYATMGKPHDKSEAAENDSKVHDFSSVKLTTSEIVELLKSPETPGVLRRGYLDLLECRYGRRFANQWAFVEFAQAENFGLDFTTRVKRPDPKEILKTIRKLLDEESTKP